MFNINSLKKNTVAVFILLVVVVALLAGIFVIQSNLINIILSKGNDINFNSLLTTQKIILLSGFAGFLIIILLFIFLIQNIKRLRSFILWMNNNLDNILVEKKILKYNKKADSNFFIEINDFETKLLNIVNKLKTNEIEQQRINEKIKEEVEQRTKQLARSLASYGKQKRFYEKELSIARKVQTGLLPKIENNFQKIKIDSYYKASSSVGGDFFEFFDFSENNFGVFLGDISGRGVGSALIMALAKAMLVNQAENIYKPIEVLNKLNLEVLPSLTESYFLTGIYCVIDGKKEKIEFIKISQANPVLIKNNGEIKSINLKNNNFLEKIDLEGTRQQIDFHSGDKILIYTDGLIEDFFIKNKNMELIDIIKNIKDYNEVSGKVLIEYIIRKINTILKQDEFTDDVTLICIENLKLNIEKKYKIKTDFMQIHYLIKNIEQLLNRQNIPNSKIYDASVILLELLTNSVFYGNKKDINKNIYLDIKIKGKQIEFFISDEGKIKIEKEGLGLKIVRNLSKKLIIDEQNNKIKVEL